MRRHHVLVATLFAVTLMLLSSSSSASEQEQKQIDTDMPTNLFYTQLAYSLGNAPLVSSLSITTASQPARHAANTVHRVAAKPTSASLLRFQQQKQQQQKAVHNHHQQQQNAQHAQAAHQARVRGNSRLTNLRQRVKTLANEVAKEINKNDIKNLPITSSNNNNNANKPPVFAKYTAPTSNNVHHHAFDTPAEHPAAKSSVDLSQIPLTPKPLSQASLDQQLEELQQNVVKQLEEMRKKYGAQQAQQQQPSQDMIAKQQQLLAQAQAQAKELAQPGNKPSQPQAQPPAQPQAQAPAPAPAQAQPAPQAQPAQAQAQTAPSTQPQAQQQQQHHATVLAWQCDTLPHGEKRLECLQRALKAEQERDQKH